MPGMEFERPVTFLRAIEVFCLSLNCLMVRLRDEAAFHNARDEVVLNAAQFVVVMLQDSHAEAEALSQTLEKRIHTTM